VKTRELGKTILAAAIQLAAPEPAEWGRAMLNEIDFVQGDLAAFWWAIGSTAAVLRGIDTPMKDIRDFPRKMQGFQKTMRRIGIFSCASELIEILAGICALAFFHSPYNTLPMAFIVVLIFSSAIQVIGVSGCSTYRPAVFPDSFDDCFRKKLEFQRETLVGIEVLRWWTFSLPGYLLIACFVASQPQLHRDPLLAAICTAIIVIIVLQAPFLLFKRVSRYRRLINEIEALQRS
jgi:hypothetical protein